MIPFSKSLLFSKVSNHPSVTIFKWFIHNATKTHIHLSSKIAETFDLLGFSREQTDCFNMARVDFMNVKYQFLAFPCSTKHIKGIFLVCGNISSFSSCYYYRQHSSATASSRDYPFRELVIVELFPHRRHRLNLKIRILFLCFFF